MKTKFSTRSRYPAQRAFVIHMAQSDSEETDIPLGRAEHLISGQATHFVSWAELETFIEQVLATAEERPP
ncbi:MAG TPA: hypothetical protein VNN62_17735 [Methylomirabilota bacterium]|nr:hypothetical protein [Methylomirabilota bacterium]